MMLLQESPAQKVQETASALANLDSVEWIDWTAIVLLGVFFLVGLFKGFWWQFSRIVTLVVAWYLAGKFGPAGERLVGSWFDPSTSPRDLPLFLSYVAIFVAAVIVFSIIAMLLQKLIRESGLSFFDRIGGAVLGLGTGGLGVVAILAGLYMFVPADFAIVEAAHRSRSMEYSQKTIELMGGLVPEPMQKVFGVDQAAEKAPEQPKQLEQPIPPGQSKRSGPPEAPANSGDRQRRQGR